MKKTVLGNLLITLVAVLCMDILSSGCGSGSVGDPLSVGVGTGGSVSPTTISLSNGGAVGTSAGANGGSTSSTSPGDTTCGTTTRDTTQAPADILIVLDRSDSMLWDLASDNDCSAGAPNCTPRLPAVVSGLGTVVDANSSINWGLELFPSPKTSTCASVSSTPQVAVEVNTASAIKSQLAGLDTSLGTPTTSAINAAITYLKTINDDNNKVILLATDGYPNCLNYSSGGRGGMGSVGGAGSVGSDDMSGTRTAIGNAMSAGFPVYVIGIGPGVSNLDSLAVAGGTGSYYPATSTAELTAALTKIAKAVSTCTFKSDTAPPKGNSSLVYVYVDKNYVAQDDSNGWKFDPTDSTNSTIVLTGSTCADLMDGKTSQVQIVFGCPGTAPTKVIF